MPGTAYEFGPFRLDLPHGQLTRDQVPIDLPHRQSAVLAHLLAADGTVVSKDALIAAVWDVAVTDNSLEQVISSLRRALASPDAPDHVWIATVPRRGYRFSGVVRRMVSRATDDVLDALLAPHRAFIEGRAALESLDASRLEAARAAFESITTAAPEQASGHLGLAAASIMQFETTRADAAPDRTSLARALDHAREACRLDPKSGEAWATLGLALDRDGQPLDALAATRQATALEPDNWRHTFRLSSLAWGEERMRAAQRTLALLPGFPLAYWMIATVLVARQSLDLAAEALDAGLAAGPIDGTAGDAARARPATDAAAPSPSTFLPVGLHWLRGLLFLASDESAKAERALEAEANSAWSGHLYARESASNAWYALGVMRLREDRRTDADHAFDEALGLVPGHPMARACRHGDASSLPARAALLALRGRTPDAAAMLDETLAAAPPGNLLWFLPVEPLFDAAHASTTWASPLGRVRMRAI